MAGEKLHLPLEQRRPRLADFLSWQGRKIAGIGGAEYWVLRLHEARLKEWGRPARCQVRAQSCCYYDPKMTRRNRLSAKAK